MKTRPQAPAGLARPSELPRTRAELAARLGERRAEIEEAMLARIYAIADPTEVRDPAYLEGLRRALETALDYGLEAIERGEERPPQIPIPLLAQARLAARSRVSLDTVLRRYFVGYTLLGDFLAQEAAELDLPAAGLVRLLHAHAAAFDRLLFAVSEEHGREGRPAPASAGHRRLALVRRLLAGERADASELRYPFEATQLGLACVGPGAEEAVREIAASLERSPLVVRPDPDTLWAWLGGMRALQAGELAELAAKSAPVGVAIAIGEAAEGLAGWRLTHRQAAAALPVAVRREDRVVRYIDVALLAAALKDELLATSLNRSYIEPLGRGRDGGRIARETLRAYFAAGRNVSSTAAMLGVNRKTVGSRLHATEAVVGRPLSSCAVELEIALRLADTGA